MMTCQGCGAWIGSAADARRHAVMKDGRRPCDPSSSRPAGLTHEWNVSAGDAHLDVVQIHGGQPDDNGTPEYVISVLLAPGGDELAAAEQIAAALRGEA